MQPDLEDGEQVSSASCQRYERARKEHAPSSKVPVSVSRRKSLIDLPLEEIEGVSLNGLLDDRS